MLTDGAVTGELLRELRCAAGIGLRRMADLVNYTPSYLSLVETGRRPVTDGVLDQYRAVLSDPVLDGVDLRRLGATVAEPSGAGVGGVDDLAIILDKTRHLEDIVGATAVAPLVRGMDTTARGLALHRAGGKASASLASEVARYRGWLEHATGRAASADRNLTDAARLAEYAEEPSQLAHALSFRGYVARHGRQIRHALDLTDAAISVTGAHPVLTVYDRYQRAELLALHGDQHRAGRALARADRAAEEAERFDLPSFGYWYTPGFWGLERGVVLAAMGRQADAVREAEQGHAALPAEHQGAGWARSMLEQIEPGMGAEESDRK